MAEYKPVIDVTAEFFAFDTYALNSHIRALGEGALVGVSFPILETDDTDYNKAILRKTKAFVERSPLRLATILATDQQVSIEPNVFYSGVMRMSPDIEA